MTTKDGYYGSDAVENKFSDPATNESYFTLVNEKTGEIEIYNEEISDEKKVATMETDGSVVYNNDWLSSATTRDEQWDRFKRENGINRICLTSAYEEVNKSQTSDYDPVELNGQDEMMGC